MKKVALYIPCYNCANTISDCLTAVLNLDFPLSEILVVDDFSTDKTVDIVSRYPVRLIRHSENKGLAQVRNTALANIDSEFVASVDSDCCPKSDWLSKILDNFDNPQVSGVGGNLIEKDVSSVIDFWRSVHMKQSWGQEKVFPEFLYGSNTVFKREWLLKVKGYNSCLRNNYEDVDISKRLKAKDASLVYEPEALVYHYKQDNIRSLFETFWSWHVFDSLQQGHYESEDALVQKLYNNHGLAEEYLKSDIISGYDDLVYLDFLLAYYLSLKDFDFFLENKCCNLSPQEKLKFWLKMIDWSYFYCFDFSQLRLVPGAGSEKKYSNLKGVSYGLSKSIWETFKNKDFVKKLYRDLFLSFDWDVIALRGIEKEIDSLIVWQENSSDRKGFYQGDFTIPSRAWMSSNFFRSRDIIPRIEKCQLKLYNQS